MGKEARGGAGTRYLPPGRSGPLRLAREIEHAARSPVVEALLVGAGTALAILNEEREILAVNAAYLALLGADDPARVLGLRPGEAVSCVHAGTSPGGCGTSPACPGCGAAIALLVATHRKRPAERDCALRVSRGGRTTDHIFRVRATPLDLEGTAVVLLTLSDVGAEHRRAALQRVFLHDLANLAVGLRSAAADLGVAAAEAEPPLAEDIRLIADRIVREVKLQRALAMGGDRPRVFVERVALAGAIDGLRAIFDHHPSAAGRTLEVDAPRGATLDTDPVLLDHVLANMLVNAFEATRPGGTVRLEVRVEGGEMVFRVRNEGTIPAAVQPRVFQRYFTTKGGEGRGQGTFAMKLFGETYLGGEVSFTSSAEEGTSFELRLPWRAAA